MSKSRRWARAVTTGLLSCALSGGVAGAALGGCGSDTALPNAATAPDPNGLAPLTGPCAPEGLVRDCHVKIGEEDGVVDCFVGKQECRGGAWGACGGGSVALQSSNVRELLRAGNVGLMATATSDAGICTQDPCNPFCNGYNEDGGIRAEAGAPEYFIKTTDIFGGAPGGFAGKSDCGSSSKGCNNVAPGAAYPRKCNGNDHFSIWDGCLADTHCDVTKNGGEGECVANWDTASTTDPRWNETTQTWFPAVCGGVDVTVSAACEIAGVAGFNVCNRGNTAITAANVGLYIENGNASFGEFTGSTCPSKAPSCSPAIPGGQLLPGKCMRVTNANCPAWTGSGNPVAYVNSNRAIAECGGTTAGTTSTAPGCNNNWADVKHKGDACSTFGNLFLTTTRRYVYTATCDIGSMPRWKTLTYNATVPCSPGACTGTNAAKVDFLGTISNGTTTVGPELIPDATTRRSVACTRTGATPAGATPPVCPVNLTTWATTFGGTEGPSYRTLTLDIRLTPTPDNALSPTLSTWEVVYDCIPSE